MLRGGLLLFLGMLSGLPPLRADLTIEGEGMANGTTSEVTIHLAGGKVELEGDKGTVILSPAEDKIILVVAEQEAYMALPFSTAVQFSQQFGSILSMAKIQSPTLTHTGQRKTISGLVCEQILVKTKEGSSAELWVSPEGPGLTDLQAVFQAFSSKVPAGAGPTPDQSWAGFLAANADLKTFPILSIVYDPSGAKQGQFLIRSSSGAPIAGTVFAPPVGFKEISLPSIASSFLMPALSGEAGGDGPESPLQQLQQLQEQIRAGGQSPTPEQLQKLQELSKELGSE